MQHGSWMAVGLARDWLGLGAQKCQAPQAESALFSAAKQLISIAVGHFARNAARSSQEGFADKPVPNRKVDGPSDHMPGLAAAPWHDAATPGQACHVADMPARPMAVGSFAYCYLRVVRGLRGLRGLRGEV